jgi:hypothetical protein
VADGTDRPGQAHPLTRPLIEPGGKLGRHVLNSSADAANSSLPSTWIGDERSPPRRRRAAGRDGRKRACSPREARTEKANASTRNATISTAGIARLPVSVPLDADNAARTVTGASPNPPDTWPNFAVALAVDGDVPGRTRFRRPAGRRAEDPRPFAHDDRDSGRGELARVLVRSVLGYGHGPRRLPPGRARSAAPGATPRRSPTSTNVLDPAVHVARASPARLARAANRVVSALPRSEPTAGANGSGSPRERATSAGDIMPAALAGPLTRASAFRASCHSSAGA